MPLQPGASRSRFALPSDLDARLSLRATHLPLRRAPSEGGAPSGPGHVQTSHGDVHIYDRCTVGAAASSSGVSSGASGTMPSAQQQTLVTLLTLALQSRGVGVALGGTAAGTTAAQQQRQWFDGDGDAQQYREGDLVEVAVAPSAAASKNHASAKANVARARARKTKKKSTGRDAEEEGGVGDAASDDAPPSQWEAGFIDTVNVDGTYDVVLRAGGRADKVAASELRARAPLHGVSDRDSSWSTVREAHRAGADAASTLARTAPARGGGGASARRRGAGATAAAGASTLSRGHSATARAALTRGSAAGGLGDGAGEAPITVEHREGMADGSLRWYSSGILTADEAAVIESEQREAEPPLSPLVLDEDEEGRERFLEGGEEGERRRRRRQQRQRRTAGRGGGAHRNQRRVGDGERSTSRRDDGDADYADDGGSFDGDDAASDRSERGARRRAAGSRGGNDERLTSASESEEEEEEARRRRRRPGGRRRQQRGLASGRRTRFSDDDDSDGIDGASVARGGNRRRAQQRRARFSDEEDRDDRDDRDGRGGSRRRRRGQWSDEEEPLDEFGDEEERLQESSHRRRGGRGTISLRLDRASGRLHQKWQREEEDLQERALALTRYAPSQRSHFGAAEYIPPAVLHALAQREAQELARS